MKLLGITPAIRPLLQIKASDYNISPERAKEISEEIASLGREFDDYWTVTLIGKKTDSPLWKFLPDPGEPEPSFWGDRDRELIPPGGDESPEILQCFTPRKLGRGLDGVLQTTWQKVPSGWVFEAAEIRLDPNAPFPELQTILFGRPLLVRSGGFPLQSSGGDITIQWGAGGIVEF